MAFLDREILGNSLQAWIVALALAAGAILALRVLTRTVVRKISAAAERTATYWDDVLASVLRATRGLFHAIVALLVLPMVLSLPADWETAIRRVAAVALVIQGGLWAAAGLTGWLAGYRRTRAADDPAAVTTVSALGFVGKLILWSVVLLLALDNLGVDVTALMAGLGVGGVAVALAAQNILGDLFASMSIVLDKPFVLGDFIIVNEYLGTVEHVGLKTTRVRSLTGEQVVLSNNDLLQSRIRNYGRMKERRVEFRLGVVYQTPRETVGRIPGMLREAVEAAEQTRFDRAHFKGFADSALEFEIVYYMRIPNYNAYMDVQQAINLRILERFEAEGIDFAYPTRTIFVENADVGEQVAPDP
jgi:small-conductance mechanosensitive channel